MNFWESWCPPCRAEMPYLQKAYEEYGQDVVFVMVNPMTSDTLRMRRRSWRRSGIPFRSIWMTRTGR
ncbi:TlpA family protein disulfide reductase [Hydrogenibacillus schlegelii]|uniref:TlpA family protein disulfide reductase n=1 Tax=Hydrogenibacillus schlegelii TaxID=1484 RepID=UPI0034A0A367